VKAFIKQNTGDNLIFNEEGWLCPVKGKYKKNGLITMKTEDRRQEKFGVSISEFVVQSL
jgi:hypothetical protein